MRVQLLADLSELVGCWDRGRRDATQLVVRGTRVVLSGGWPRGDDEYPTDFAGVLARLIGSGAAEAAGFAIDE